ncbi:MAG: YdiU family protein [Spirochaetota bacterium]
MISFQNTYIHLPERFYKPSQPAKFASPSLLCFNDRLADELYIDHTSVTKKDLASVFSGQTILPGSQPIAQAYAGHQFGYASYQLGDGRALLLGETAGFDIQLKGSGQTPFSRSGDGRSALGPVIREYLVSEAMYALGVPTTRALAAVRTGEEVYRQFGPEPGGILTRVAPSHIRVGTFQYFAFRKDTEGIKILLDYTIEKHYPGLKGKSYQNKSLGLLQQLSQRQVDLVAHWMSLGFIHGVMNTDNFSIAGITLDYGPCAFMDAFHFHQTFSSIDVHGRYSYSNQLAMAEWNLLRLADCLLPLIDTEQERAVDKVLESLGDLEKTFASAMSKKFAEKLGLQKTLPEAEKLVKLFLSYLHSEKLDFTLAFRYLNDLYLETPSFYPKTHQLDNFLSLWKQRVAVTVIDNLHQINPLYIPRNHQVERAIQASYQGDDSVFFELLGVLQKPFEEFVEHSQYALSPRKDEIVHETFCGT